MMVGRSLIRAIRAEAHDGKDAYLAYWRRDTRDAWQCVRNKRGLPIIYMTEAGALAQAEAAVKGDI
jgi:hypothetical protein